VDAAFCFFLLIPSPLDGSANVCHQNLALSEQFDLRDQQVGQTLKFAI
jgi:hypothetical protein